MWSWVLSVIGIAGTVFVGRKYWWAWLYLSVVNLLWTYYSITTRQWGFLITSIIYAFIYAKNLRDWYRNRG